jgi:hypothetical protein
MHIDIKKIFDDGSAEVACRGCGEPMLFFPGDDAPTVKNASGGIAGMLCARCYDGTVIVAKRVCPYCKKNCWPTEHDIARAVEQVRLEYRGCWRCFLLDHLVCERCADYGKP